jgi:putative glutathione S-transferase
MGLLVDGEWHDVWYDTKASKGRFVRSESQFRNWVTPDGSPSPAATIYTSPTPAHGRIAR